MLVNKQLWGTVRLSENNIFLYNSAQIFVFQNLPDVSQDIVK